MDNKTTFQNSKNAQKIACGNRFFALVLCIVGFSAQSQYCQPDLDCTDGDLILNVTLSTLSNPSECGADGFSDFTLVDAPTLTAGQSYPISVTVGDGWAFESVSVWIDYNGNNTFDASEFTFIGTGSDNVVTQSIAIPTDVTSGNKRMRVRVAAVGNAAATAGLACDDDQGYGETEDYTVNIAALNVNEVNSKKLVVIKHEQYFELESPGATIEDVQLFDMAGKCLYEKSGINQNTLPITTSAIAKQVLVLKVKTSQDALLVRKILS